MTAADDRALLAEQVAFYRAWAATYDETVRNDLNERDRPELREALAAFAPVGDVIEFAGGTGSWTKEIAGHARSLTVIDASPEALALNREALRNSPIEVDYVTADLFSWRPQRSYDVAFFSFWLSHVPHGRFASFWELVASSLRPRGRVFFIDSAVPRHGAADVSGGGLLTRDDDPASGVSTRRLDDGREYQLVKIHWQPEKLVRALADLGWDISAFQTSHGQCIYGFGAPRA